MRLCFGYNRNVAPLTGAAFFYFLGYEGFAPDAGVSS